MAIDDAAEHHKNLDRNGWARVRMQPLDLECVATAIMFIAVGPVKHMKIPRWSSYSAKHAAERWGRNLGFAPYIANGDFLAAALSNGRCASALR